MRDGVLHPIFQKRTPGGKAPGEEPQGIWRGVTPLASGVFVALSGFHFILYAGQTEVPASTTTVLFVSACTPEAFVQLHFHLSCIDTKRIQSAEAFSPHLSKRKKKRSFIKPPFSVSTSPHHPRPLSVLCTPSAKWGGHRKNEPSHRDCRSWWVLGE